MVKMHVKCCSGVDISFTYVNVVNSRDDVCYVFIIVYLINEWFEASLLQNKLSDIFHLLHTEVIVFSSGVQVVYSSGVDIFLTEN